jgi:hypothetical protein
VSLDNADAVIEGGAARVDQIGFFVSRYVEGKALSEPVEEQTNTGGAPGLDFAPGSWVFFALHGFLLGTPIGRLAFPGQS